MFAEGGVDQGLQHLQQCLLDQSIQHRGDAQLALAPVRFGDHHFAYRTGPVASCQQTLADVGPALAYHRGGLLDVEPVHPGGTFVGFHPLPRRLQVLSRQRRFQQATGACLGLCQPCVRVLKERAAGFVADEITHGSPCATPTRPGCPGI